MPDELGASTAAPRTRNRVLMAAVYVALVAVGAVTTFVAFGGASLGSSATPTALESTPHATTSLTVRNLAASPSATSASAAGSAGPQAGPDASAAGGPAGGPQPAGTPPTTTPVVTAEPPPPPPPVTQVSVPNVVGYYEEDAIWTLEAAGLVVNVTRVTSIDQCDVRSQTPVAGTLVDPGTTVTIRVARPKSAPCV